MRMHVVQHVPFEGPAMIAEWAAERGFEVTTNLAITEEYPDPAEIDFLVIMGGPMDADDHLMSPWLGPEKAFLVRTLYEDKRVLGVCLGAQILAETLGGAVHRGAHVEIGWFPLTRTDAAGAQPVFDSFFDGIIVGHWHGDTFSLPAGVNATLSSEATVNQAFSARGGRVVGLQFHAEWTAEAASALIAESADDLVLDSPYVATQAELEAGLREHGEACRAALWGLLDAMLEAE
ncbi:MAG TPA: type 1 glutamine amidotransferase [Coriobacteriia bacterium]|nr:type 1 glutamine amidotransferase [Coriobacteriia bacterium]